MANLRMRMRTRIGLRQWWHAGMIGTVLMVGLAGCSGGGDDDSQRPAAPGPRPSPTATPDAACVEGAQRFASTFEGIQAVIFERHGCTQQLCHGDAKAGGLDLSPGRAYESIFEVRSNGSALDRIEPGDNDRSYLWRKLAAKTVPGSVEISGSPMPSNLPALDEWELELLRLWIYAGAPEAGSVPGTAALLGACLPAPEPIVIAPLAAPAPGQGFQLRMPEWKLERTSEQELCFATYFDISDQVPEEFRDPSGTQFRFHTIELRQDPQSHHLILYLPPGNLDGRGTDVDAPEFGTWRCVGGSRDGDVCQPKELSSCDRGICTSEAKPSFACIGYGPASGAPIPIGGAQQAQAYQQFHSGVFAQLPMKGLLYWNTHAFNLSQHAAVMHARLNYLFTRDQRFPVHSIFDASSIFAADAAPFTMQSVCSDHVLPQGARLFHLTSHTHKRGKRFTVDAPDGTRIYESLVYNDPLRRDFDPPLAFDSPDSRQRTLRYCALYNNGLRDDGTSDPDLVTRLSRFPASAGGANGDACSPVACAAGRVGASCGGRGDDAACDSRPHAGDGQCDACRITGGESTENEMFILIGTYFVDPAAAPPGVPEGQ